MKRACNIRDTIKKRKYSYYRDSGEYEGKRHQKPTDETVVKNFPSLKRDTNFQKQEIQRTPNRLNQRSLCSRLNTVEEIFQIKYKAH